MNKIIIQGAGGVAGIGMTRCLNKDYEVYGSDLSLYARKIMEAKPYDVKHYDLKIPVPDRLVYNRAGEEKTILPDKSQIYLCQDKIKCAKVLGDLAPKVLWIRDKDGAGGKGAQMAQEYLPGKNFSCELAYFEGELIGYFAKERISYSLKNDDEPLEKRGSSKVSVCVRNDELVSRALFAVQKVCEKTGTQAHGFYGVDFKENEEGTPLITEINAGRLLTASYVYFYSTEFNLPLALVKKYFGEEYELGKYPEGIGIIRCMDKEPYVGKLPEEEEEIIEVETPDVKVTNLEDVEIDK